MKSEKRTDEKEAGKAEVTLAELASSHVTILHPISSYIEEKMARNELPSRTERKSEMLIDLVRK